MFEVTDKVRKEIKKDILKIMATKPGMPPPPLQLPRYLLEQLPTYRREPGER